MPLRKSAKGRQWEADKGQVCCALPVRFAFTCIHNSRVTLACSTVLYPLSNTVNVEVTDAVRSSACDVLFDGSFEGLSLQSMLLDALESVPRDVRMGQCVRVCGLYRGCVAFIEGLWPLSRECGLYVHVLEGVWP
jgi:hypothetical protein